MFERVYERKKKRGLEEQGRIYEIALFKQGPFHVAALPCTRES